MCTLQLQALSVSLCEGISDIGNSLLKFAAFFKDAKVSSFLDGHMNEVRPQNASVRSTALGRSLICLRKHLFFRDNEHAVTNAVEINCKV